MGRSPAPNIFAKWIFWSAHFWPLVMGLVAATLVWLYEGPHAEFAGWGGVVGGGLATSVWLEIMNRRHWSNRLLALLGLRPGDVYRSGPHITR
jgi:hypothetical protein